MAACPELVRRAALLSALVSLLVVGACSDGGGGGDGDAVDAFDPGGEAGDTADLPEDVAAEVDVGPAGMRMDVRCSQCHVLAALPAEHGDETVAPGGWLDQVGEGLVRYDPSAPLDARMRFEVRWPRRGRHTTADESTCSSCHPVYADGRGHSVAQYPALARQTGCAEGGNDCATGCHLWLSGQVSAPGFDDADGLPTELSAAARPELLLAGADNAHATIWKEGFQPTGPREDLKVSILSPGCAGCHNLGLERHGRIETCTSCHDFGGLAGALHGDHVALIASGMAADDPSHPDRQVCVYCHDFNEPDAAEPDEAFRRACYGCHLSGHQPMNADGQAHFWPLP